MHRSTCAFVVAASAATFAAIGAASAQPIVYTSTLLPSNNSGVTGQARLTLDGDLLTVNIQATGLEPNQIHAQHIHGRFDASGEAIPSVIPGPEADTDGDGFVEDPEGEPLIGPILLPLTSPPGTVPAGFPTAPNGTINFTESYDLTDLGLLDRLLPLELRAVQLHGLTVGEVGAGTPFEVNGIPGYKDVLPVAAGLIRQVQAPVSEPATIALLGIGLAGLIGVAHQRRKMV